MNGFDFFNPPRLFIEIGPASWQVLNGEDFMEFPLERPENGRLSAPARERLVAGLRHFVNKKGWRPRRRAFVAIGARGVSLRRLTLPSAPREEFQRLLRMQIESEFPLPPDELAWGWQLIGQKSGRQEVLVAAVKKEMIEPCAEILEACGISPLFTLAALARNALGPPPLPSCAVLHIGADESELLLFQDGAPASIRLLSWGSNSGAPLPASCLNPKTNGGQLYLTGKSAPRLAQVPGPAASCPVLEWGGVHARSAAIAGLKKWTANQNGPSLLIIQLTESRGGKPAVASWKWAAAALLLLLALLGLPCAEALVLKPHLAKKLAALQADRTRLPAIDRELEFLQFLKRSQPPYLDTVYLIAKVAPPGTTFESLAMTRRGDLSVRGNLGNAQQVTEFRSNLIQSAWFSSVVVEEQTPTPNRQVTVRMIAKVKSIDGRKPLVVDVAPPKPERATNSARELKTPTNFIGPPKPEKK
jgi:hypothetical protein